MADLDYTGFGPTSAGRAPSAAELRRSATNRYHSTRAIEAMRFIDPTTIRASEQLIGMGMGKDRSPEAVRRTMYSTAAGQGVMDAAMLARTQGMLGYGDPRQYSANVVQMMSGGFRGSVRGGGMDAQAGRMIGFNQRVSGNGMLTERAAIGMQRSLLDNLYGKGQSTDPRKLNGYDMTEASQVAARVVGRGGMGNMVGMIKNADFGQRMAAAEQSEIDPEILAKLQGISKADKEKITNAEKSGDSSKLQQAIDDVAATLKDPKAEAAFRDIAKSTDAMVFNEESAKKLSDTVKEVTKGMAALNDIYGDLSSDQAHALLEQVHGGRITNKQQARAATRTVDNMRNAAEYAGMDPKELFGLFAQQQQKSSERVGSELGMDARTQRHNQAMASKLAAAEAPKAAIAAKGIAEAARELGFDSEGPTAEEIAEDSTMMQVEAAQKYKAYVLSQSDMKGLKKEQKAKLKEKAAEFKIASDAGDTQAMRNIETEMQNVVGPDFETQIKQGQNVANLAQGMVNAESTLKDLTRDPLARNEGLRNVLTDAGMSDSEAIEFNKFALKGMGGVRGLKALMDTNKIQATDERIKAVGKEQAEREAAEERAAAQRKILDDSGAGEAQRAMVDKYMFDEKGNMKEQTMRDYTEVMMEVDKTGGLDSKYDKALQAEISLSNLDKNDMRSRLYDKNGGVSARGVITAMLDGGVDDPLSRADTAAASLDVLKSMDVPLMVEDEIQTTDEKGEKVTKKVQKNLTDMYTSGISLDKGLSQESLDKIDKVAGGKVNLADRVNKKLGTNMTQEEMLEKSKNDVTLQNEMYLALHKAGGEMGFDVRGSRENLSFANDDIQRLGGKFSDRWKKTKGLGAVSELMSKERLAAETTKVLNGGEADIGDLMTADKYDDGNLFDFGWNDKTKAKDGRQAAKLSNSGKFDQLKDTLKSSPEKLAEIAGTKGSDKLLASLDAQIKSMETAVKEDGAQVMIDDKGQERELNQQTIAEYKAIADALRSAIEGKDGAQKVGTMTVTKLEVTGDFNSAKK